jgi:hypothetical protein
MSAAGKLLIFGGVGLAALGMIYGLHYAVFAEHQRLDHMGGSLATAFVEAANRNPEGTRSAIEDYRRQKFAYVREVDVHSHWVGLAMLAIALGVVFDASGFAPRTRFWLAVALLVGALIFPLGVLLQNVQPGSLAPSAMAVSGVLLVTIALAGVAFGFARK